jgi:hypothetical protein
MKSHVCPPQKGQSRAEGPLGKVTSDARLAPEDWKCLARFVAAQDVRTPAHLGENCQLWNQSLPGMLDNILRDVVQELNQARETGEPVQQEPPGDTWPIPLRVTKEIEPGHDAGKLKAEVVVGRSSWLFSMRHLLTKPVTILQQQKWTILSPPKGMYWLTSDDPVIKLNYRSYAACLSRSSAGSASVRPW